MKKVQECFLLDMMFLKMKGHGCNDYFPSAVLPEPGSHGPIEFVMLDPFMLLDTWMKCAAKGGMPVILRLHEALRMANWCWNGNGKLVVHPETFHRMYFEEI